VSFSASKPYPEIESLQRRLRGVSLPGGHYTIEPDEANAVARLLRCSHAAHPIFSCVASLKSLGVSIGELCSMCEFELADGPLLGEFAVRFVSELQRGIRYQISVTITSIDRTHSARLGVLDRLRFQANFASPDGTVAVEARYLWLLPRGGAAT
jgi:hypothetical protein